MARGSPRDLPKSGAALAPASVDRQPGRPRESWLWDKPMDEHVRPPGGRLETEASNRDSRTKGGGRMGPRTGPRMGRVAQDVIKGY